MALLYVGIGINHFIHEANFEKIVPPFVPFRSQCVYVSGALEIVLGLLVLIKRFRRIAAMGLIVLLIVVFPANVYMYSSGLFPQFPQWILLLRLPLQLLLIVWAVWIYKSEGKADTQGKTRG